MASGRFRDVNGILREADGRFAKGGGGEDIDNSDFLSGKRSSHGSGPKRRASTGGGGGRGRKSTREKITLAAGDIGSAHLRRSENPTVRKAGVVLSAIGSVARNRAVRSAVREATRNRKKK